jgi:small-conductance mechanosensitive channel
MPKFVDYLISHVSEPAFRVGLIMVIAVLLVAIVQLLVIPVFLKIARKSSTTLDNEIIRSLRNPVSITIILIGLVWSIDSLLLRESTQFALLGILKTFMILLWGMASLRVGDLFLNAMSRNQDKLTWIQPQTLPLLYITWKVFVYGGIAYFLFIAWKINPAHWFASAGVAGIAIGFAAKDTLANLIAGIFLLTDAPFKIGDFVILDSGLRGMVTDIGVRTCRVLTRDDVEVTVPNAVIANAQIINEAGGPYRKMRVRVEVYVAYGSDVDQVRDILLSCVEGVDHVVASPAPRVRFREFGGSGLRFELLAWIERPVYRGRVLDVLNEKVYKTFNATGVEIPFAKQDVYVKEWPRGSQEKE